MWFPELPSGKEHDVFKGGRVRLSSARISLYAKVWFSFRVLANLAGKTHKSASNLVANRANT